MIRELLFTIFLLVAGAGICEAACAPSGANWTTTGDSTSVQQCIDNADSGDTITITTNGTWSGTFSNSAPVIIPSGKSLTLQGTGYSVDRNGRATSTNITITNGVGANTFALLINITSGQIVRIMGLTFDVNHNTNPYDTINVRGAGGATEQNFRFDHSVILNNDIRGIFFELASGASVIFGNIDHNTFECGDQSLGSNCQSVTPYGALEDNGMFSIVPVPGTSHNLYVENNNFNYIQRNDGCVEAYGGTRFVMRFNTVNTCLEGWHGNDSSSSRGPSLIELYNNTFTMSGCSGTSCNFGMIHGRSGMFFGFNNTWTSEYSNAVNLDNYRSNSMNTNFWGWCDGTNVVDGNDETSGPPGRHCMDQIGTLYTSTADGTHSHMPAAFFNNYQVSTLVHAQVGNTTGAELTIIQDSDLFNEVGTGSPSSCTGSAPIGNGTCGVGYGVHASRPATCTGPDAHGQGGVLYWETDTGGNWDTTNGSANDGQLFRCTATNTWTSYYIPYTYPYPGTGDSPASPTVFIPALPLIFLIVLCVLAGFKPQIQEPQHESVLQPVREHEFHMASRTNGNASPMLSPLRYERDTESDGMDDYQDPAGPSSSSGVDSGSEGSSSV